MHRRTYNSKRYPLYIRPFNLQSAYTPEKKHKLAYIPTIQYIYTKKSSWPKEVFSNSSQIIQWTSVGHITIHFRGCSPIQGPREGLRSHILAKKWPFLTPPANPVQFFCLKMPSKCVPWIVLQVLTSTRTSRRSLRPPKRPSKAKNGQKITVFGLDPTILVQGP